MHRAPNPTRPPSPTQPPTHRLKALPDLPPPPRALPTIAAALGLNAQETDVLWAVAAPALSMAVFRLYRARWPQGPWPSLEAACHIACGEGATATALATSIRRDSPLTRWGIITLMPRVAGRTAMRVAPDVLRALAGRTPLFPTVLAGAATLMPLGVGWATGAQSRLANALAALHAGKLRWVHVAAEPVDGVHDAIAVDRPTLAIDTAVLAPVFVEPLRVAARVARLRRLWLLIRATPQTWPRIEQWARTAAGPFIIEAPPACVARTVADMCSVRAEALDVHARCAIWRAEADPSMAQRLAERYTLGRAAIRATVDAVRLREQPLSVLSIEAELARRGHRLVV